jgi:hypothetical protein
VTNSFRYSLAHISQLKLFIMLAGINHLAKL